MSDAKHRSITLLAWALLSAGLCAPSVRAQNVDKELDRTEVAIEGEEEASEAAVEAADAGAAEGGNGVTFEDVMADPDNIELNYKYAKARVQAGDLRSAVATLERILMVDPALPKVRLFYAIVLYRLDSLAEAQKELLALRELPMPGSLRGEIDEYLRRIKKRRQRTNLSGRLGLGFQFDTNRNASPNDGRRLFANSPVVLTTGLKEDDQSLIALAAIDVVRDLGTQQGHTLDADFTFYRAEQTELDSIDFEAYSWALGGTFKSDYGDVKPSAVFAYGQLDNNAYLRSRGVELAWEKTLKSRWQVNGGLRTEFQEFINSPTVSVADERTGQHTAVTLGANYIVSPAMRVGFRFRHIDKDARRRYNAFKRESFGLSHQWLLGKGLFLLTNLTLETDNYDQADRAISNKIRHDSTSRLGTTFGAPLGLIAAPLKDLVWTAGYEYFNSAGNLINYQYDNHKLNMMFTYKWEL